MAAIVATRESEKARHDRGNFHRTPTRHPLISGIRDLLILPDMAGKMILEIEYEDQSVPLAFAGDGIRHLVRQAFALAVPTSGVVLLEEPETNLHPRAMAQTALAIWTAVRRDIQVVLTTHSLEFVDFLISEADDSELEKLGMFRLRLINGVLGYTAATGAEMEFARANIAENLR